jgi:hypothetical protein
MKKLFAILFAALIVSAAPVLADGYENGAVPPPYFPNPLESRILTLEAQIAELLTALGGGANQATISGQRREAAELERFMFQMKYYGVCLAITQNELLSLQIELMTRQLALENVRLRLGFTTQNNINELTAALDAAQRQAALAEQTIASNRRQIETRRGFENYDFIREFNIPRPGTPRVRNADELRRNLFTNNASLSALESAIHSAPWTEDALLQDQRDILIRQLEIAAVAAWNSYQSARTAYVQAAADAPLLQTRLRLLENMYSLGKLSEIEKLAGRFEIQATLHNANTAATALSMAIAEIDFMSRGIVAM